ncbi:CGNR zinc finger domain-containing protein [Kitasatospora kazusensis]|uniref:CGNR zinc finger domain-containing protein n=1 Tax=Kitasatospora kazusensis TaxID=407974 RepID=A0ABN2Z8Z9_9ACTN
MSTSTDLRFDTGRVCLDLLATMGGNLGPDPVERLDSPERLAAWLHGTGIVPADEPLTVDATTLAAFVALRACLHRVIHRELAGEPAAGHDLDRLNRITQAGPPRSRLVRSDSGALHRRLAAPPHLEELLAAVGEDAVRLLASPERGLLRECEGAVCDLVYLDASRGHRRRWCSPATCGNRHNVAAHRARKTEPH